MAYLAICPSCSKKHRLPHLDRVWRCKSCGTELEIEGPIATTSPRGDEALALNRELRQASKRISRLQVALGCNLALLILLLLLTFRLIHNATFLVTDSPLRAFLWGAAFIAVFAAHIFAMRNTEKFALPIVVALAATYSLGTVLIGFMGGPVSIPAISAIVLWAMLPDALVVRRLLKSQPDLPAAKRIRGANGAPAKAQRSKRGSTSNKTTGVKATLIASAAALALLGAALFMLNKSTLPPDPAKAIEAFAVAWNSNSKTAVAKTSQPGKENRFEKQLGIIAERYEWGSTLPPIATPKWAPPTQKTRILKVRYSNPTGNLEVGFKLTDETWYMSQIDPNQLKSWRP